VLARTDGHFGAEWGTGDEFFQFQRSCGHEGEKRGRETTAERTAIILDEEGVAQHLRLSKDSEF